MVYSDTPMMNYFANLGSVSNYSVSNYIVRAKAMKLEWPIASDWTEQKFYRVLFPSKSHAKSGKKCMWIMPSSA